MGGAAFGRTPRRGRALPRPSGRKASLLPLFRRLTPRDLGIFDALLEHRVLTIHQLLALFFDSASIARRRMLELFRLALVDRFHPPMVRSGPTHYVLDHLGARVLAAHRGIEFRELGWTKEDIEALPYRQEFRHLMATNDLIVHLVGACRANGAHRVTEWRGELWCQRAWAEMVFPDAYVQLQGPEGAVGFFVELDMGTESPSRLQAKLARYEEAAQLDGCPDALVFCFPTPEREIAARRRLWNPGLTLATGVFDSATCEPLGDVWLPIDSQVRVPLLALRRGRGLTAERGDAGMRSSIIVAFIAAFPPTLAAVLGYLANSRSIRRSIGAPPGIPLARALERLDEKVDHLAEGQAAIRERLAKLEGIGLRPRPTKSEALGG